jgi:hypothetical protein
LGYQDPRTFIIYVHNINAKEFKSTIIPDAKIRKELLRFILEMTHIDPGKRPSIKEAMQFFVDIEKKLAVEHTTINICVFDVNKYANIKNEIEWTSLCEDFKKFTQVIFVDPTSTFSLYLYMHILRHFELNDINVSSKFFHGAPLEDLLIDIDNYLKSKDPSLRYEYHVGMDENIKAKDSDKKYEEEAEAPKRLIESLKVSGLFAPKFKNPSSSYDSNFNVSYVGC